jgi:hypothetical protein
MAVRLSALRADRPLALEECLVLISVGGLVGPRAIVRLEGLGKIKSIEMIENRTRDPSYDECVAMSVTAADRRTRCTVCALLQLRAASRNVGVLSAHWICQLI